MKLFSLFTSANRSANRRNRLAVRAKRPNLLSQSDFFEGLEKRQLLATFNYNSGTGLLTVVTNQNSETLSIVSTSNAGNYTITTTGTWSGTSSSAVGNVSKNLFVNSTANINQILISSNAANSGSAFYFGSSTGNFVDNLTVNFTNSTSGGITVANRTSFINGSNLNLTTAGNQITVSNLTSANSTGSIRLTGRNIVVTGNLTTEEGDISLTGNNGTYRTGTFDGVRISGAAVNVNTTSGNITIDGRGGLNSVNAGVNLTSSKVQADGSGGVTITGVSGNGSTGSAHGIFANGSTVTTNSGSITVNGTSCGTGIGSKGVYLKTSANISATGAGNLTITGSTSLNFSNFTGVHLNDSGSKVYANGGLITLSASSVNMTGTVNATSAGNVLIQTLGAGVDLGNGTDTSANLGLSQTELNQITANMLTIGNSTTGAIVNTAAISRANLTLISGNSITQTGAGKLTISGTANFVSSGVGTAGNITLGNATNDFETITASGTNISVNDLNHITIGAITSDGDFTVQGDNTTSCISVTGPIDARSGSGNVSLTGLNIVVTGNITTAAGDIRLYGKGGNAYQAVDGVCISGSTVNVNTTSGNITIDGRGASLSVNAGVNLQSSKVQAGGSGCVTITGMSGNGSTNNAYGIFASGATVTTNSGSLTVNGNSCGTGLGSMGVRLTASANISATGAGHVTITGTAANGTNNAYGIIAFDVTVTTNSGSLTVNGNSCGTGEGSTGVALSTSANLSATGAGHVTITGTAANGTNNALGIRASGSTVTTSSGSLTVNGTSCGTGLGSRGVYLDSSANISATGAGNVTITGTAANGTSFACGILVIRSTVTTSSGSLTVNGTSCGTGASSVGVRLNSSTNISATGAGNVTITGSTPGNTDTGVGFNLFDAGSKVYANGGLITLTASSMSLSGTVNATTAGNVLIQTFGVGVNLGGADSSANLGLTSTEINQITAATIQIGSTASGNVTVSSNVTIPVGSNLTLVSNNAPSTGILSYGTLTIGAGKVLDISALPSVKTQINGTTAQTQYSQLNVVGNLSIAGRSLNLSGSYTPVDGDVFVVASATSLTGTFTGLADGSTITLNGSNLTVNYTPTAVTLTAPSSSSAPSITTQPTSQTATAGATATFTAAASGTPTPTVKWQSNNGSGWSDIPLATSNSYTTGTLTSGDNGTQYRAIYTNGVGTDATTNAATLTVNFAPSINSQPTNQTVNSGQSATFTAAAIGNPTPVVQWQVNDGLGWVNVTTGTGGTTNSYTTAALTSTNNGYQYRALYSNSVTANVATIAATITVNSSTSAPVITVQPVNTGVEAGQTATFTAAATGNPTPTVQWQSSPDGSTGWADIGGATSPTLSFTASAGDNGKYYRAVFSNTVSPDATTNSARLAIGVAPIIITVNEMTIPVGMTSGMTVIATGSPAPIYSIATGALPAGVTLNSTTGLFMGTPAPGTAGNWPVTIKAENGIGAGATQAFSLKVTSTITNFTVSKGVAQRSYIRYLDLGMDSNASALALLNNPSRVQLTKADLNGVGSAAVPLAGFLSVPTGQSTLSFNFGTIGLCNSRNTSAADGYYTLGVDLDGNGTFETNLFFFRIFGDTNGDKEVTLAEQNAVLAGCSQAYNINLDLNGDGVVNTSDFQYVKKSVGKKLKSTLIVTS